MKKIMMVASISVAGGFLSLNVNAGFDEKVAASFSAKYEVCALKLKDTNPFMAIKLKAKADEISRDKLGGGGYIKAFQKEKKKAWLLSKKKCTKLAKNI
jgi:hypothetical protein